MEFQEVVRRRRMVRRYRPDAVPEDAVERIVSAALRGPSAGFSQGIDLIVVTERQRRQAVLAALGDEEDSPLLDGPVQLIITADEDRYHRRYNQPDKLALGGGQEIGWPVPYWFIDAGAAMMLVLLAAVNEGLGAGFFGDPDQLEGLQQALGLPPHAVPIGVIVLGYSGEQALSPEVRQRFRERRRSRAESVHRERW